VACGLLAWSFRHSFLPNFYFFFVFCNGHLSYLCILHVCTFMRNVFFFVSKGVGQYGNVGGWRTRRAKKMFSKKRGGNDTLCVPIAFCLFFFFLLSVYLFPLPFSGVMAGKVR
jgi:hypothetical protein